MDDVRQVEQLAEVFYSTTNQEERLRATEALKVRFFHLLLDFPNLFISSPQLFVEFFSFSCE